MKKFSKLILESKNETRKMSPLTNPVDWEEIFKPLIEHIEANLQSKAQGPGNGVFTSETKGLLDQFIDKVEEDYKDYFQYEIHDGSQESFLQAFNINVDYRDIMDCIQPILDQTNDIEDYPNWDGGYLYIGTKNLNYRNLEEFIEDIEDIHLKLKMLNVDYKIQIHTRNTDVNLIKTSTDITKKIKDVTDLPGSSSEKAVKSVKEVSFFIFNKDTVQVEDLD